MRVQAFLHCAPIFASALHTSISRGAGRSAFDHNATTILDKPVGRAARPHGNLRLSSKGVEGLRTGLHGNPKSIDCTSEPFICKSPFNCQREPSEAELARQQIATLDGHADYSSWCDSPYIAAARECYHGNLTGYASVMHRTQLKLSMGGRGIESMDAHYCFSFGHCENSEVTATTTLMEAEDMCDRMFGHDKWTNLTFDEAMGNLAFFPEGDLHMGPGMSMYLGPRAEYAFAQMACAMGSFHCDVVYCKQEYCSQPEFMEKYGHLKWSSNRAGLVAQGRTVA